MSVLGLEGLLMAWERAEAASPALRPVVLAATAGGLEPEAVLVEPLGRRDTRLWAVRTALVDADLTGFASCPGCAEAMDVTLPAAAVGRVYGGPAPAPQDGLRPVTTADLLAVEGEDDPVHALAARCGAGGLPEDDAAAALLALDPAAELLLNLTCPACGWTWDAPVDLAAFVWVDIERVAGQALGDVAVIAAAFGWTEADILALSPLRRRLYVELAQS